MFPTSLIYLWMQLYIKVREHHRVVSKAVYIATGIREDNRREVLGLSVDHVESFESWTRFLQQLKSRGIQSPKLVISDAHQGLQISYTKGVRWNSMAAVLCPFQKKHHR